MDMVEKVAGAICPYKKLLCPYGACQRCRQTAKNAIAAMREPSRAMLSAAEGAMSPAKRPTPKRVSCKRKHKILYQAMIDKALDND